MARVAPARLADALDGARSPRSDAATDRPSDHGPVVVTFDDGTADLVDVALPILCRHRVPAVFYLATDFIEHGRPFPNDGVPLSWAAAREAVSTGLVTIGSHTDTHALLDRVDPAVAAAELDRSRQLIEDRVGVTPHRLRLPEGGRRRRRPSRRWSATGSARPRSVVAGPTPTGAPMPTGWPGRRSSAATGCATSSARRPAAWRSRSGCGGSSTGGGTPTP